ncbi:MAG: efflux RND transporter periplasmic adaptor subunit [Opitutales bacterium]|nr:efflux RND transporter periplasmic adaptor subunit [Opitutales bacterium]
MKKIFFIALGIGLVGAMTFYIAKYVMDIRAKEALDPTPTAPVKKVDIYEKVTATGFVEPIVSTEIRSEINGKIARIFVQDGDVVKAGDVLVELDKTSLQSEESMANNEYNLQKLTLEQEERDFARQEELMKKGFAIAKDYDDAKTKLSKARIQLEVKKSEWEKAKDNLSKTSIIAPQSGTVTDMDLTVGQVIVGAGSVNSGTLLMKVSSLENLYAEVKINEIEIEKIGNGKAPIITFESMKDISYTGEVLSKSPYAKNENNTRVFPVKVGFKSEGGKVRPGISANVEFPVSRANGVCAVSLSAVSADAQWSYVFARNPDESWRRQRVETGIRDIRYVEIKRGLKEGDIIALSYPKKNFAPTDPIADFPADEKPAEEKGKAPEQKK